MRSIGSYLASVFLFAALVNGCTNNTTSVADTGRLAGKILLNDATGQAMTNASGVTVAVQGTSFAATSTADGKYSISDLPAGIYNIIASKPGFDSVIVFRHHFLGAGTDFLDDIYLNQDADSGAINLNCKVLSLTDSIVLAKYYDTLRVMNDSVTDTVWISVFDTLPYQTTLQFTGNYAPPFILSRVHLYYRFGTSGVFERLPAAGDSSISVASDGTFTYTTQLLFYWSSDRPKPTVLQYYAEAVDAQNEESGRRSPLMTLQLPK